MYEYCYLNLGAIYAKGLLCRVYVVLVVFRSVTFVFLILDFNTFLFLWRTSLKTTCLRDGCFLLKDCFIIYYILLLCDVMNY